MRLLGYLYGIVELAISRVVIALERLSRNRLGYIIVVAIVVGIVLGTSLMRVSCSLMVK